MDSPRSSRFFSRRTFLPTLVLACVSILAYVAIVQPWSLRQISLPLSLGDVAPQDLRAPRNIQYASDVLTEAARAEAERAVAPVYIPPDTAIARTQSEVLNSILVSISAIRTNQDATLEQKKTELIAIQGLTLQPGSQDVLLILTDTRWELVQTEAFTVLEQAMQNPVRTEDLDSVRQNLPSLVSLTLTEKEAALVVEIVAPMVVANSFYSPELTDAARQTAREAVEPATQSFVAGQTVVTRGQVLTAANLEALTALGLVQPQNPAFNYLGAAALVALSALFTALYIFRLKPEVISDLRGLILLALLFAIFLVGARVSSPNRTIVPYLFPIPAFALLVSALFGMERGLVFGLLMSLLAAYGMPDALGLLPYYTLSSLCGVLALGQARRVGQFLFAAIAIAVAGAAMVVAYRLPFTDMDWVGLATLMGAAVFAGIVSTSIALPMQYLLAQFLGLTTALQLLEISRPDAPLLNYFLQRAPGTYQHSLQVANLAEQAAERIHADTLLIRVGALFHDVGKSTNPLFFVENQPSSQIDSHDDLAPEISAEAIIRHVPDGLGLARKYRLPRRLYDFIAEHHGTLVTRYQYNRAVQAAQGDASKVDQSQFRYPGPSPRSKETAILMFADGVEAQARAERPHNDDEVRTLVRNVIERCQKDGQLDHTPLSQRDLASITESFIATLRVTYHPRLEYPQEQLASQPSAEVEVPTTPRPAVLKKHK
ncbi:MAG: HDIG domain-containing protein [Candidatus Atribacteria bacterium]|nr:HDIG domain-containing protein [Candidatus Atribacteria bacterium]